MQRRAKPVDYRPSFQLIFANMFRRLITYFIVAIFFIQAITGLIGCAQIGMPTGGDKDSIPPSLVRANPPEGTLNFNSNRITLEFDEFIDIKDPTKILISPYQNRNPQISYNLRTVTIRLRDTLRPNTTYSINFGNSLADLNEGNPYKNYSYVFSTGDHLDSMSVRGRVIMAETGLADSTLQVYLYNEHLNDSTILKHRPQYAAPVDGQGNYEVNHLPPGTYKAYVLKDNDGRRTYNNSSEIFAFLNGDSTFNIPATTELPLMLAYEEQKFAKTPTGTVTREAKKQLNYSAKVQTIKQDITRPLEIVFNQPVGYIDTNLIKVTDTLFANPLPVSITTDSTNRVASISATWQPGQFYLLHLPAEAAKDTSGGILFKGDTIRFQTQAREEYGRVVLRFQGLPTSENPTIQISQNNVVMYQGMISNNQWSNDLIAPGEYDLKILLDRNGNGKWDPGKFSELRQPERIIPLPQKLSVRADWDNERDVILTND